MGCKPSLHGSLIQQGFLEIYYCAGLENFSDTNALPALPAEVIDTICEVTSRIGEPNNLNPAFTILVTHQYVDADRYMRQMYLTRWVARRDSVECWACLVEPGIIRQDPLDRVYQHSSAVVSSGLPLFL
jgi:hypothetical protein